MSIMIAIPCYRCAPQLPRLLDKLSKVSFLDEIEHIAIIDNRSPDETVANAFHVIKNTNLKSKANIYLNDSNYGLGGSHKVAFNLADQLNIDHVIILHGDDQANVEEISHFISFIKNHPDYSAVLGSRFSFYSKRIGYQKMRVFGNLILNLIFSIITLRPTYDLGSGLNLFNLSKLREINITKLSDHFSFNSEFLLEMYTLHLKVHFLPITWEENDQQSNARNFSVARKMLQALFRWRFKFKRQDIENIYQTTKLG
jgi:dolichol-phosphate mannosyltransferase